jgi:hypothetical protein
MMSGEYGRAEFANILTQDTLARSLLWSYHDQIIGKMGRMMKYPPCNINPMTEKPYTRHQWIIPEKGNVKLKAGIEGPVTVYRVFCKRCGINDPAILVH